MSKLSRNILFNIAGQTLLLILSFAAVRFVFRQFGEDALGIIYFTLSMSLLLGTLLDMGLTTTVVREVSSRMADEPGYVRDLLRTASLICWVCYGAMVFAVWMGAPIIVERWINLREMDPETATQTMRILGCGTLLVLPRALYSSLFRGIERMGINNSIDVGTSLGQQAGMLVLLLQGAELLTIAYWLTASFVLGILVYLAAASRFVPAGALVPGYSADVIRRNWGFTIRMAGITVLGALHNYLDKAVASRLLPLGAFGFYGYAWLLVSRSSLLTASVAQAALPSLSTLHYQGNRTALMSQYRKLQDFLCLAIVPVLAAVPFVILPLFGYLFTPAIAQSVLLPATVLCLGFYMQSSVYVPYTLSLAMGKPEITVRSGFYALLIMLPGVVVLISYLGIAGAALSWVVYHCFVYAYAVPRLCRECLGMKPAEWYFHAGRILVVAVGIYGTAWFARSLLSSTPLAFILAFILGTVAFLSAALVLAGPEMRAYARRVLRGDARTRSSDVIPD